MLESLTKGEQRVVDLVARGWTNGEVADELSVRPKTVEWTLTKVYRKLRVRSRTELALKVVGGVGRSNPGISLDEARNAADARLRPPGLEPASKTSVRWSAERRSR